MPLEAQNVQTSLLTVSTFRAQWRDLDFPDVIVKCKVITSKGEITTATTTKMNCLKGLKLKNKECFKYHYHRPWFLNACKAPFTKMRGTETQEFLINNLKVSLDPFILFSIHSGL